MTAPENMPRIICFCPTTKMIRDGSMQITIPAIPEFCVAQDLICHHACRFLGCQNQMDAQASADAGDAHQLVQEIWLLLFQLRKLIRDDKKMRHRLFHNA